jgi:hypothetical protein
LNTIEINLNKGKEHHRCWSWLLELISEINSKEIYSTVTV